MRVFLTVMLVTVLAVMVWLICSGSDDQSQPQQSRRTSTTERDQVPVAPRVNRRVTMNRFAPPSEKGADRFTPHDPEGRLVHVVDAQSGQPVPGAILTLKGEGPFDESARFTARRPDDLLAGGPRYVCDAQGSAKVPWRSTGIVLARSAERVGTGSLDSLDTLVIPIRVRRGVKVVVTSAYGQPVDHVPVCLRFGDADSLEAVARAWTDTNGEAFISNVAWLRDIYGDYKHISFEVAIDLPVGEHGAHAIDLSALPESPIALELPPLGSVSVRISGSPTEDPVTAAICNRQGTNLLPGSGVVTARCTDSGVAVFPRVGLSEKLIAYAWSQAVPRPLIYDEFEGVRNPDQCVEIELRWHEAMTWVTGILCDENEQVLANTDGVAITRYTYALRTDVNGRWWLPAQNDPWTHMSLHTRGAPPRHGALQLPARLPADGVDMGRIIMQPAPLLASGLVLGPAGHPVPGVDVRVQYEATHGGESYWYTAERQRTDAHGRFAIYHVVSYRSEKDPARPPSRIRLETRTEAHPTLITQVFTPGVRDMTLRLSQGATATSELTVPAGVPPAEMWVELVRADEHHRARLQPVGNIIRASWRGLPPGTYDLVIRCMNDNLECFRLRGIGVQEGAAVADPRFLKIDLRPHLKWVALTVLNPDGTPAEEVQVSAHADGLTSEERGAYHLEDDAGVLMPLRGVGLRIEAKGTRETLLLDPRPEERVVMRPTIKLVLRLGAVGPPGWTVTARIAPGDARPRFPGGRVAVFDATGRAEALELEVAGRWSVQLFLDSESEHHCVGTVLRLDIPDVDTPVHEVLPLDPRAVARALGK